MSTYWCNVFLSCEDTYHCDLGLLEKIHSLILNREATITTRPDNSGENHCLSVDLNIAWPISESPRGGTADALYRMAGDKAEQWIRDFPRRGLPFCRHQIFPEYGR